MDKKINIKWFLLVIGLVMVTSACQLFSVLNEDQGKGTPTPTWSGYKENAIIETVEVLILESYPVQVQVVIKGMLPDGCTNIALIKPEKIDENTFKVMIFTEEPRDLMCTQALVPFEETVNLEVEGLPAGTYSVQVYDQQVEFKLDADN